MSSMFDFDDSQAIVFQAKTAGKALIAAKYETIQATGDFLFNAHSDLEFARRCEMIDDQLSGIAYNKLASLSDSKTKLVKALHTEWSLRHAKCEECNCGKNRKVAKSTCEMCADGELDSDSPLCKACRSKEASSKKSGPQKVNKAAIKVADAPQHGHITGYNAGCRCEPCVGSLGKENFKVLDLKDGGEKRPFDWERDASRTASDGWNTDENGNSTYSEPGQDSWSGKPHTECQDCGAKYEYKGAHPNNGCVGSSSPHEGSYKTSWGIPERTANKYIEKRGNSWVILQKGTGKVLSHHSSKEKAEASFRAMMQSKHEGSNVMTAGVYYKGHASSYCPDCGKETPFCVSCGQETPSSETFVCDDCQKNTPQCAHCGDSVYQPGCDLGSMHSSPKYDRFGNNCTNCGDGDNYGPVCDLCGDQMNEPDARISLQNNGGKFISCDNCDETPQDTELHDQLHEDWHRKHGDSPCTSVEDCKEKSKNYKNS